MNFYLFAQRSRILLEKGKHIFTFSFRYYNHCLHLYRERESIIFKFNSWAWLTVFKRYFTFYVVCRVYILLVCLYVSYRFLSQNRLCKKYYEEGSELILFKLFIFWEGGFVCKGKTKNLIHVNWFLINNRRNQSL